MIRYKLYTHALQMVLVPGTAATVGFSERLLRKWTVVVITSHILPFFW